jgi:hypothetical protein
MSIDTEFSRALLGYRLSDVKSFDPALSVREAWVWCAGKDHWEFHFNDFYWHGSASNAYDARSKGWAAWLRQAGAEGYGV